MRSSSTELRRINDAIVPWADPTQWSGQTTGGKTVLIEATPKGLHLRGKSTLVIEKKEGTIRGVTRITGADGRGHSYAKVASGSGAPSRDVEKLREKARRVRKNQQCFLPSVRQEP